MPSSTPMRMTNSNLTWLLPEIPAFPSSTLFFGHRSPFSGIFLEHHQRNYKFDSRVDFWNVKIGIGNPIVFELPDVCRRAALQQQYVSGAI